MKKEKDMFPNFMFQDVFGVFVAFFIFPLVIILPGYIFGWAFDLFEFRARLLPSRFVVSLLLSFAISPIFFYLIIMWTSPKVAVIVLALMVIVFFWLVIREKPVLSQGWPRLSIWFAVFVWLAVAMFSLVDLQLGQNELYFSVASYDHTTRVSIIDAMTRTGVPPINPSYYPGHYVQLTFLYFFWYILGSLVDIIGGPFVDARMALHASVLWCGIALMAATAFYLRLRDNGSGQNIWKKVLIGISLLSVTGLDILPSIMFIRYGDGVVGDLEHWNEQITAWVGSLMWVPHHVASLIAGLVGLMLVHSIRERSQKEKYTAMAFAGVAFASAVGLSIWVTLIFVLFWGIWMLTLYIQKRYSSLLLPMIFAGVVSLLLAGPFLLGIVAGGSRGGAPGSSLPIALTIRAFRLVDVFTSDSSLFIKLLARLIILPLNYLFELGFFFLAGFVWLKSSKGKLIENSYYFAEFLLFAVSFFVGTFTRSTLIENNDLGWRAWLPGQFILLIWGVDVFCGFSKSSNSRFVLSPATKYNLVLLAALGLSTTLLDIALLRFGFFPALGPEGGRGIYSARRAYTVINKTLPTDAIVQYNPSSFVNRPSGLYGMRQSVISDRTSYGVPLGEYLARVAEVSEVFNLKNVQNWEPVDILCRKNFIEVMVLVDSDPLWQSLDLLGSERDFIYKDDHYAVFPCGDYFPPPRTP